MSNSIPKVTVLMPVYNVAAYIQVAIESVLAQTFVDFELLIINDGSTDDTGNIISRFDDNRIRLINQPHVGIAAALNIGLLNARASLIARFDGDDVCFSYRLNVQYRFMTENPDYILIGSDADYIDKNGEHLFCYQNMGHTHEDIFANITLACPFIHASVMYVKSIALELGGYDMRAHTFEDYFLWTRFISKGKVCNLKEPLIAVRLNPESVTVDEKLRGKRFAILKKEMLFGNGLITEAQEQELLSILQKQDFVRFKNYSYNILVAKKYLWNNYQPAKARKSVWQAISLKPFQTTGYGLFLLSCIPKRLISKLYKRYKPVSDF